jgi:hypothetical protein
MSAAGLAQRRRGCSSTAARAVVGGAEAAGGAAARVVDGGAEAAARIRIQLIEDFSFAVCTDKCGSNFV